jgi:uncharacterized membrane protein YgcG
MLARILASPDTSNHIHAHTGISGEQLPNIPAATEEEREACLANFFRQSNQEASRPPMAPPQPPIMGASLGLGLPASSGLGVLAAAAAQASASSGGGGVRGRGGGAFGGGVGGDESSEGGTGEEEEDEDEEE